MDQDVLKDPLWEKTYLEVDPCSSNLYYLRIRGTLKLRNSLHKGRERVFPGLFSLNCSFYILIKFLSSLERCKTSI